MRRWRGAVVLVIAAIGGFAGGMLWLLTAADALRDHTAGPAVFSAGCGWTMAAIFYSAEAAAKVLQISSTERAEIHTHFSFQKSLAASFAGLCLFGSGIAGPQPMQIAELAMVGAGAVTLAIGVRGIWVHGGRHFKKFG